jgi:hypothetical protein
MNAIDVNKWRTVRAFFIAPFIVPSVLLLPLPDRGNYGHFSFAGLFGGFFLYLLYGVPIAYAAELFLGLPAWMLFKHYGIRHWPRLRRPARFLAGSCTSRRTLSQEVSRILGLVC